jgi:hypothetical protein
MIRALILLCFVPACTPLPVVDAAEPETIAPRPAYLTPDELAKIKARLITPLDPVDTTLGDDLRNRADDLRAR